MYIKSGQFSIVIKGLPEDEAVLCTDSKTFNVRQVNTSNSIILIHNAPEENRNYVHDDVSNTIELLPCLAKLGRLDELLRDTSYSGAENEQFMESKVKDTINGKAITHVLMLPVRNYTL